MSFSRACAGLNRESLAGLSIPILSTEGLLAEVSVFLNRACAKPPASGHQIRFQEEESQFKSQSDCSAGQESRAKRRR